MNFLKRRRLKKLKKEKYDRTRTPEEIKHELFLINREKLKGRKRKLLFAGYIAISTGALAGIIFPMVAHIMYYSLPDIYLKVDHADKNKVTGFNFSTDFNGKKIYSFTAAHQETNRINIPVNTTSIADKAFYKSDPNSSTYFIPKNIQYINFKWQKRSNQVKQLYKHGSRIK
jgi:hypothetical protein